MRFKKPDGTVVNEIKCKECNGVVYENECTFCKRVIEIPKDWIKLGQDEKVKVDTKVKSHGLERKDKMAGDAYQKPAPEFADYEPW